MAIDSLPRLGGKEKELGRDQKAPIGSRRKALAGLVFQRGLEGGAQHALFSCRALQLYIAVLYGE